MARRRNFKRGRGRVRRRGNKLIIHRPIRLDFVRYKYRQVFNVVTSNTGHVNILLAPWSFSLFATLETAGGSVVSAFNEPLNYQKKQFDFYKPTFVKIKFMPISNNSGPYGGSAVNNSIPPIYWALDSDNKGAPSSVESLITRDKVKSRVGTREYTVSFRLPDVQQAGNQSLMRGYNNLQLEAGNVNGSLWGISRLPYTAPNGSNLANTQIGEMMITYYVSYKGRQYNTSSDKENIKAENAGVFDLMAGVTGITQPFDETLLDPPEPSI